MIISHKHKFIFQKCRKTAGSSIQVALSPHLGALDLQIGSWSEVMAAGGKPNLRYILDLARPITIARSVRSRIRRGDPRYEVMHKQLYERDLGASPEHAPAALVQRYQPDSWSNYFKFCFVRNPYDKAVSDWRWRSRLTTREVSFSDWLVLMQSGTKSKLVSSIPDNWPIYTIDDNISVDFVGKFENLDDDLSKAIKTIGLPHYGTLTTTKQRGPAIDYHDIYTQRDRKIVEALFGQEIEAFKYMF